MRVQARAGANDLVVEDVTVNVSNVDEPGVVVLSSPQVYNPAPLRRNRPNCGPLAVGSSSWKPN